MASLNLSTNGPSITNSYQKVVNSPTPSGAAASSSTYGQWAIFTVQAPLVSAFQAESGKESVLKVQTTGEGELVDMIEDFSDGRIQFAFVKVKDPNTTLPKNVLIAWCGEGVPERTKGYFTSHVNAVSKLLHGYHVQITARSDKDLTPESIVQKVADSSGSRYGGGGGQATSAPSAPLPPTTSKPVMPTKSFGAGGGFQPLGSRSRVAPTGEQVDEDGWGPDAPQVTRSQLEKVESAYQPTKVNMNQLQSQNEPSRYQAPQSSNDNDGVIRGGYQPIGKVDISAIRAQSQSQSRDDRPTVVKGAYEPVGKVDIAEIRRKAQGAPAPEPAAASSQPPQDEDDRPKSLADRSAAFQSSGSGGRLTSLPKPQVANRFGSQASSFAGTKAPLPGGFDSRPAAASAAPVGTASKTFADEGGKTPAQIWAEKKARQRGTSGAGETQPSGGFGAPASPVQSQTSGNWQSNYEGKKWDVQIPSRTGGSVEAHRTGEDPARDNDEHAEQPATGNVGAIRDRFKDVAPMGAAGDSTGDAPEPPPLDNSSKPNAGARGVPIPGMPQRQETTSDDERQDLPPPPPRGIPQDEPEDEEHTSPRGSPVRIAMPVSRSAEPLEKSEDPPQGLPTNSLQNAISQHKEPEDEEESQNFDDEPARSAGQAAAASTFGQVEDPRSAGTSGGKEAIAQYDYEKAEDNELQLAEGERITNIEMVDEDWWIGENSRGEKGLFPANYVELTESDSTVNAPPAPAAAAREATAPAAVAAAQQAGPTATAQFDYEAAEDNELSFPDGGKITDVVSPWHAPNRFFDYDKIHSLTLLATIRNFQTTTGGLAVMVETVDSFQRTTSNSINESFVESSHDSHTRKGLYTSA